VLELVLILLREQVERLRPRARELDTVLVLPDRRVSRETAVKLIIMKGRQAVLKAVEDKLYEVVSAAFGVRSSGKPTRNEYADCEVEA
jgi:hypothetical protein